MSTYTDTCEALAVCIASKQPVILWGAPGQGKTSVLNAIAASSDRMIRTVLASIREPSDFAGLPNIVNGRTVLIPPDWAEDIAVTGDGILFFDEISTAPPATQAAMLRVALERIAGDKFLGDDVSIVAAANPPEQAADGWDLSAPMANRFTHLDWALPADVVRDGFSIGWPEIVIPQVNQQLLNEKVTEGRLLVGAFLGARPDHLTRVPDSTNEAGRAFPTPRSWESAATLYGYATAAGASKAARRMLLNGSVGESATSEFLTYISELDLPNPEDVLANPSKWEVPTRGDRVYAVGAAVLTALKQNMSDERWVGTGKVIAHMAKADHSDVAVAIGRRWMKMRPNSSVQPDAATLRAIAPVFKAAKIF